MAAGLGPGQLSAPPPARTGWRYWRLEAGAGRLASVSQKRVTWVPGETLRAFCIGDRHPAPHPGCACGVYATGELDDLREHGLCLPPGGLVIGRVHLWGTVIEDADGWRGAAGYPASLSVVRETVADPAAALEALRAYGVPVDETSLAEAVGPISAALLANQIMSERASRGL